MKHPNDKAIYVVRESPYGKGQIVMEVTDSFREGYLCFFDTNRGHMFEGKIISNEEETFTFRHKNGEKWVFEIVTIEKFKESVHRCVSGGKNILEQCNTTEELWGYFEKLSEGNSC